MAHTSSSASIASMLAKDDFVRSEKFRWMASYLTPCYRVESLFLDEGFGTLDEEALNTALETLSGLRRHGKLIGVISHLPALKERISAQIQVTPQPGGGSQFSGPGCIGIGPS